MTEITGRKSLMTSGNIILNLRKKTRLLAQRASPRDLHLITSTSMSNPLPPFSSLSARTTDHSLTTNIHLPSITTWSHTYINTADLPSSPPRSSSPPKTPYSTRHIPSYAYIRTSPRLSTDSVMRGINYHPDDLSASWDRHYNNKPGSNCSLPSFNSLFSSDLNVPSTSEYASSEAGDNTNIDSPNLDIAAANPVLDEISSMFGHDDEITPEDEEEGFSFEEETARVTCFRTSAERGRWKDDPNAFKLQNYLQMRKSVPIPSSTCDTSMIHPQRLISEPAPSTMDPQVVPGILHVGSVEDNNSGLRSFLRSSTEDCSSVDRNDLSLIPSLSHDRDTSSELEDLRTPSSPLPPSSPLSPMSFCVSPMSRSVSPLSFAMTSPVMPIVTLSPLASDSTYIPEISPCEEKPSLKDEIRLSPPLAKISYEELARVNQLDTNSDLESLSDDSTISAAQDPLLLTEHGGLQVPHGQSETCMMTSDGTATDEIADHCNPSSLDGASTTGSELPHSNAHLPVAISPVVDPDLSCERNDISSIVDNSINTLTHASIDSVDNQTTSCLLEITQAADPFNNMDKGKAEEDSKDSKVLQIKESNVIIQSSSNIGKNISRATPPSEGVKKAKEKRNDKKDEEKSAEGPAKKKRRIASDSNSESPRPEKLTGEPKRVIKLKKSVKEGKRRLEEENDLEACTEGSNKKRQKKYQASSASTQKNKVKGVSHKTPPAGKSGNNESCHVLSEIDTVAAALDTEICGMLIECMALSRASSLPVSSLHKSLIQSRPSMKDEKSEEEWVKVIDRVLRNGEAGKGSGVFGKVESSGKDDCDRPLEARWFYIPELDEDQERATLIRSMMPRPAKRNETKKYKQYYWRPLEKISRWDPEDEL